MLIAKALFAQQSKWQVQIGEKVLVALLNFGYSDLECVNTFNRFLHLDALISIVNCKLS